MFTDGHHFANEKKTLRYLEMMRLGGIYRLTEPENMVLIRTMNECQYPDTWLERMGGVEFIKVVHSASPVYSSCTLAVKIKRHRSQINPCLLLLDHVTYN